MTRKHTHHPDCPAVTGKDNLCACPVLRLKQEDRDRYEAMIATLPQRPSGALLARTDQ